MSLISSYFLCFSRVLSLISVTHQFMISLFQSCLSVSQCASCFLTYQFHSSIYVLFVSVVCSHLSVSLIDLCSLCFSHVFSLISVTHQFMFSLFQSCLSVTPCAPCFLTYPCHSSVYDFSVSVVLIGYAVCAGDDCGAGKADLDCEASRELLLISSSLLCLARGIPSSRVKDWPSIHPSQGQYGMSQSEQSFHYATLLYA